VIDPGQREMRQRPTYSLKREESDERCERWVVDAPAEEKTGGELETLIACEDSLFLQKEILELVKMRVGSDTVNIGREKIRDKDSAMHFPISGSRTRQKKELR
jgi:hypothetical protein